MKWLFTKLNFTLFYNSIRSNVSVNVPQNIVQLFKRSNLWISRDRRDRVFANERSRWSSEFLVKIHHSVSTLNELFKRGKRYEWKIGTMIQTCDWKFTDSTTTNGCKIVWHRWVLSLPSVIKTLSIPYANARGWTRASSSDKELGRRDFLRAAYCDFK